MPTIRLATAGDAPAVHAIYAPIVQETAISFEYEIPPVDEIRQRILSKAPTYPWLVLEHNDSILGYAYGGRWRDRAAYSWSVEVTVYVIAPVTRAGVGRALYTSLQAVLRLQGFNMAYAGITLPNAGSVGLHEAVGFRYVGTYSRAGYKFGTWHDVGWWQIELNPPAIDPQPTQPLPALIATPAWDTAVSAGLPLLRL